MWVLRWWENDPTKRVKGDSSQERQIGTEIYKYLFGRDRAFIWSYLPLIPSLSLLQVSIKFSKEQGLPGSRTSLYLRAAPDSFCALRAVDKSVLLLKPEQELSAESVSSLISAFSPFLLGLLQIKPFRWYFWDGTCWKYWIFSSFLCSFVDCMLISLSWPSTHNNTEFCRKL